ncbi:uncharacterized protein HMPREF1541_05622 [Cyphellophora europaea CBS 101466]|uniref:Xylanolytic transcriptional activator regulatory domain-containing protein n=1 Tax=Cyphellophora europaea (strain CBS 101466) TaxID=1220924 RepID=W2RUN5_CYPE1|nr:uncharacterized protein HMPREF1541_05622 [Cyphellophora europaea CBS 101466]ETN39399.1 hypothetical protein HMPREF1541_05622 [Cyphellophora europaea CBS 101466]
MILNKLERLDAKIDQITVPSASQPPAPIPGREPDSSQQLADPKVKPISFSAHLMIEWPAVRELLPQSVVVPNGNYALQLEEERPNLPISQQRSYPEGFLADLSVSTVRELSDAYFATFNLMTPVLDRKLYFHRTLGAAINGGFGYDADSCVVLMTMALGCWGSQTLSESHRTSPLYHPSPLSDRSHHTPSEQSTRDLPGLAFYNEARKRIGFLECEHSMQICQFYLLAATYLGQLLRPVDCWSMTMRAGTCCLKFWETSNEGDEWTKDMFSRLFWITVMFETVFTQELTDLPASKIRDMEDRVPLPKFVQFKHSFTTTDADDDESFYHYHFLSQIAHRIFLTRVYSSSYYCTPTGDYPNMSLTRELYHQLDQWRSQLPPALRFDDDSPDPDPEVLTNVLVVSWLRARYSVARYHLGRPFLYKALHHPYALTEHDRHRCKQTLESILRWAAIMRNISNVKSCIPLAFLMCGQ